MTIHDIADKYAKVYTESFARCGGTLETTPFARLLRAKGRKRWLYFVLKKYWHICKNKDEPSHFKTTYFGVRGRFEHSM